MMTAQLVNLLYSIVDRIYIGQIPGEGTVALAGLGLCFPVIMFVTAFTNLCGGGAPLCAIERGRGDGGAARRIIVNAWFMLLVLGAALTVSGIAFCRPLLFLFGASSVTIPYAQSYLSIYMLGTLFVMTALGLNPYINCQGFAKTGMKTVLLGAAANIILDPIFIFALGMGIRGAAIATVISQAMSALWVLLFLTGKRAELTISLRGFRPDFSCIRRIASLGLVSFVMSANDSLVQIACNSMLSIFGGDMYISVMTILISLRQIVQTPILAVSDGSSPVISFNYGAGKYGRVLEAISYLTFLAFLCVIVPWLAVTLLPHLFIMIFNQQPELIAAGVPALRIYFAGFVMMGFQMVGQTTFKSLNMVKYAIFFSIFRKLIIVVPLTLLLPYAAGLGANGVFLAEPISNAVGGLLCYFTMRRTVMPLLRRGAEK
jgi:putative MATE family efflux protein